MVLQFVPGTYYQRAWVGLSLVLHTVLSGFLPVPGDQQNIMRIQQTPSEIQKEAQKRSVLTDGRY